jgi:hypothetical protein
LSGVERLAWAGWASAAEGLGAFAVVGDERADEFFAVVDVDEFADLDDADGGAVPA